MLVVPELEREVKLLWELRGNRKVFMGKTSVLLYLFTLLECVRGRALVQAV